MDIVFVLLPLSLLLAFGGFLAWVWAWRRGQFDDLDTPPLRSILDEQTGVPQRASGATPEVKPVERP